jgi:adenylate cyclase
MPASRPPAFAVNRVVCYLVGLMPVKARLLLLVLAGALTSVLLTLLAPALTTLEESLGALGWTLYPDQNTEERITIVAIDEKSIAQEGPWPWRRETMARLVTALTEAGVQLQLHDIVYPEAQAGDEQLLAALQSSSGVVLAQVPALQPSGQDVRTGVMTHPLTGIACDAGLPTASGFVANASSFASIATGHIAPIVAADGAIREVAAAVCLDGLAYPALPVSAFLQAVKTSPWGASIEPGKSWFGPAQQMTLHAYPGLRIPLDQQGSLRISYRSAPEAYRAVSAADVLNGSVDLSMLANTWVLLGATAFGIGDIVPTPYSGATPGVELQARMLGSLLDADVPYTPLVAPWLLAAVCLVFAGLLLVLASYRERFASAGLPLAGMVLPLLALALHIQWLASGNVWLGWVAPALYGLTGASLLMLLEQARVRHERSRVFGNLNSYLPADVAHAIAFSLPSSSVNASRSDVTLLSADLRNFSAFGEARPPEESAALLHFFFVRATEIVESFGGRIHEFKGDALLAVWDGQGATPGLQALGAAQQMQATIDRDMLPQHPPAGLEPLALGIGIEQGPVLIGSIGPAHRRTHTMLGDTVTITLRIQEMTAELAQPILLGECVARQLTGEKLESQGSYLLSGLRTPHILFAPLLLPVAGRRQRADAIPLSVITGGRR